MIDIDINEEMKKAVELFCYNIGASFGTTITDTINIIDEQLRVLIILLSLRAKGEYSFNNDDALNRLLDWGIFLATKVLRAFSNVNNDMFNLELAKIISTAEKLL